MRPRESSAYVLSPGTIENVTKPKIRWKKKARPLVVCCGYLA